MIGVSLNGGKSFRLTILVGHLPTVRAVTEKSVGLDMFSESVDGWQAVHFYELCDLTVAANVTGSCSATR